MNDEVKMIAINKIRILNPRHRDRKKFEVVINSIKKLGLKKPIQVSLRSSSEPEGEGYDLICGQGRIEAYLVLGYKEIPAVINEVSKEDRLLRSLVENMARRFPAPADLLYEIERLKEQGDSNLAIAGKLGISDTIVGGYLALRNAGEERLLDCALKGKIPVWIAMDIARAEGTEAQSALLKAYESKQLNQSSLRMAKRVMEQRQSLGKLRNSGKAYKPRISVEGYVAAYKRESNRQKQIIKKADICSNRLIVLVSGFRQLLADEDFVTLLRAESLVTMPKYLANKITDQRKEAA